MPGGENSLPVSSGGRTFTDYMLYGGFVDLIANDGAYLNKCFLALNVIISDQVRAGEIELLGIVLQNIGQLRDQLG